MKLKITVILYLMGTVAFSQDLPKDPQTGLISIIDSFQLNDQSIQDVQNAVSKWGFTLLDPSNVSTIYHCDNSKQQEKVSLNFHVSGPLLQPKGNNAYATNGSLGYSKVKTSGFNTFAPVIVSGGVKFEFSYTIYRHKLVYQFTNLEYTHDGVHFGQYESVDPPKDNTNRSLWFGMSKKEWSSVKIDYFNKLKVLVDNFKSFIPTLLQNSTNHSGISYTDYQRIKTGTTYDEVVKILGEDGKELSNSSSQVNGKTVTQQTIMWTDLDKSKNITISFVDGRVTSKSQNNL